MKGVCKPHSQRGVRVKDGCFPQHWGEARSLTSPRLRCHRSCQCSEVREETHPSLMYLSA